MAQPISPLSRMALGTDTRRADLAAITVMKHYAHLAPEHTAAAVEKLV